MDKKTILKKLLKVFLISLLTLQYACEPPVIAFNCSKIGYKQSIDSTFFDKNDSKLYFIYSYLDKKDSKAYFLYKIDLNGKVEKILDLGSKIYDMKNQNRKMLKYAFRIILNNNDKLLLEETMSIETPVVDGYQYSYSHLYYDIDLKDKNLMVYKKEDLSFTQENKNLFNPKLNEIEVFNIEKGIYYNNTIPYSYKDHLIKWVNANTIIRIREDGIISIYELKDNNINKTFEYNIKPNDKNIFLSMTPENYIDNTLSFYSGQDLYNLDFTSNSLSLVKANSLNNHINSKSNILLRVGKKMYLYNYDTNQKLVFDYLNELPKSFYSDESICRKSWDL